MITTNIVPLASSKDQASDVTAFFAALEAVEQGIRTQAQALLETGSLLEEDEGTIIFTVQSLKDLCTVVDSLSPLFAVSTNETIGMSAMLYMEPWYAVRLLADDVVLFVEVIQEVLDLRSGRELLVMIEDSKIALGHLQQAIEDAFTDTSTWRQLVERESRQEGGEA
jgi:hypothetical protein